jgi:hypothetical protein
LSVIDRVMKGRTRGITVEERKEIAAVAKARPSIDMEIHFDYDSAAITPRAEAALKALGDALNHPDLRADRFLLAGHTDGKGGADYNRGLSERRAEAVKTYLVEKFLVSSERLLAIGYGFDDLKKPSDPMAAINRRVQISNVGSSSAVAEAPSSRTETKSDATSTRAVTRSASRQQIDGALDEIAAAPKPSADAKGEMSTGVAIGDVGVDILPGTSVRIDDIISVRVTSRIEGSLIVYEEDAAGNVTQIFPNSLSTGSRPGEARTTIAAGESILLPGPMDRFQLRVTPPAGESRIIAIVLPKSVKVDDVAPPNAGMKPVGNPGAVLQTLAKRATRGVRVEPSERAVGIRTYTIGN